MPIYINGTTGISGVDGSASTPAVQGSDTNTGMYFPAADTIAFTEGGVEVLRLNSSGTVILQGGSTSATGVGITFPAIQSASSNANTLDDYEEGTWTPSYSLGSGSATFTTQVATYTKIGKVVTISLRFVTSGASSAANLIISGLPFPFENSNADSSGIFREYTTLGNFYGLSFGSSTSIYMQRYDNNNAIPNGGPAFSGTLVYQTTT